MSEELWIMILTVICNLATMTVSSLSSRNLWDDTQCHWYYLPVTASLQTWGRRSSKSVLGKNGPTVAE